MLPRDNRYRPEVILLMDVLPLVAEERCFALKGGTAINLFVRDLPRLSVDIDLAYVPVHDRATSLDEVGNALERIALSIERQAKNIRVDRIRAEGTVVKLMAWRGPVRVKIEVSPVLRGCVREPVVRGVCPSVEAEFGYIEAPLLHHHDLYAGKLCAALDRQHPRDLFDVQVLLEHEGITNELFEVFLVYLLSSDHSLADMLAPARQPIATVFEEQFRGMALRPVTLEDLTQARETMIALVQTNLTERHRQFLLTFKRGEPAWDLLGVPGAADLPAVQWNLVNVRRMTSAKREQAVERLRRVLYG